jgi:hypothetical protein
MFLLPGCRVLPIYEGLLPPLRLLVFKLSNKVRVVMSRAAHSHFFSHFKQVSQVDFFRVETNI